MRTETETIIEALRILAGDIFSEDGIANLTIAEAADRMEELCAELLFQKRLAEKYVGADKICAKILSLAELDKLYRDENHN